MNFQCCTCRLVTELIGSKSLCYLVQVVLVFYGLAYENGVEALLCGFIMDKTGHEM